MDITSVRLASAALLLVATALCGIVPIAIFKSCKSRKKSSSSFVVSGLSVSHFKKKERRIISYDGVMKLLMFFGGGILLATCFVHMIPEVRENFDNYFAHHHPHSHSHHDHDLGESHDHSSHDHLSHDHSAHGDAHVHSNESDEHPHDHHHDHDHSTGHLVAVVSPLKNETALSPSPNNSSHNHSDNHGHKHGDKHHHDGEDSHNGEEEGDDDHHHSHSKPEALSSSSEAPDHQNHHEKHSHHGHTHSHGIPYVELAICGGFFFIYLLEEIIHTFIGHSHEHGTDGESVSINTSPCGTCSPDATCRKGSLSPPVDGVAHSCSPAIQGGYVNYGMDLKNETQVTIGESDKSLDGVTRDAVDASHSKIFHTNSFDELVLPSPLFNKCHDDGKDRKPVSVRFIQGLVVIVAFSAHSIFDGVAIGLQEDSSRLWTMFFAICSHKLVVALAVGMDLFEKTSSLMMASILMIIFSLMSPIGILLVIVTEAKVSGTDSPVIILLSAVATGTILYIVFFEILVRQRSTDPCKLFGLLLYMSMILGFTLMFLMTMYIVH